METIVARKMWATLEPYHAMIYFAPEAFGAWEELGFPDRGMGYFASRSAPMGRVEAPVVSSTFYNFSPALVSRNIPRAWDIAEPAAVIPARVDAAEAALERHLGEPDPEAIAAATSMAETAAAACPPDGRPLFAAHAALEWPDRPLVRLWHAVTLLREFRGDGHVVALVDADVSGIDAVRSYAATGEGPGPDFYRRSRGWTEDEWAASEQRLAAHGWLTDEGELTDEGRAARDAIEEHTDRLAMAPWRAIGEDAAAELRATIRPWSRAIVAAGGLRM